MRSRRAALALAASSLLALAALTARHAAAQSPGDALAAPRLARLLGLSGTVVAEVLVDSTGAVRATSILRSQPLLDDSAAVEVTRRSFPPSRDAAGRATPAVHTVAIRFEAPPFDDPRLDPFVARRCEVAAFALQPEFRPDSAGTLIVRWTAGAPRSHELRLLVLTPDAVVVDTAGSSPPQRLLDTLDPAVPGWPTWQRSGKQLREGAGGTISLRLPLAPGWSTGRVAFVALFHDAIDRSWIVRQAVYRIEHDAVGPVLLRDALVDECRAGPFRP